jgi:predicted nuclease of predicted toxin-antitoxin system
MQFKIDENLHDEVAALLASAGHDAHTVHVEGLTGGNDSALAAHCRNENRVLVTLDRDFADIRAYPPADHTGLIVLRVGNQSRRHVLNVTTRVLDLLKREPVAGRLWIVSEAGVRIRGG